MPRWDGFAALDWSGASGPRQRGIAISTCSPGDDAPTLVRPGHVWSRMEALEWVLDRVTGGAWLIGFDLSPALPFVDRGAYFPEWPESPDDARGLWRLVERLCADEAHLGASGFTDHPQASRHFRRHGGRVGDLFEAGRGRLRVVERAQLEGEQRLSPSSCFNLVGAAQVGKSSLTGMRVYHRLDGSVPLWPFDPRPAAGSVVVEIYTTIAVRAARVLAGRSKVRDRPTLDAVLRGLRSAPAAPLARYDDHATDALVTAAWLRTVADAEALWSPPGMTPGIARTEGWTFGVP